jgi:hypothetical protein
MSNEKLGEDTRSFIQGFTKYLETDKITSNVSYLLKYALNRLNVQTISKNSLIGIIDNLIFALIKYNGWFDYVLDKILNYGKLQNEICPITDLLSKIKNLLLTINGSKKFIDAFLKGRITFTQEVQKTVFTVAEHAQKQFVKVAESIYNHIQHAIQTCKTILKQENKKDSYSSSDNEEYHDCLYENKKSEVLTPAYQIFELIINAIRIFKVSYQIHVENVLTIPNVILMYLEHMQNNWSDEYKQKFIGMILYALDNQTTQNFCRSYDPTSEAVINIAIEKKIKQKEQIEKEIEDMKLKQEGLDDIFKDVEGKGKNRTKKRIRRIKKQKSYRDKNKKKSIKK